MMNKKQTSHRSMWKYTLILPVIAILLIFNGAFQTKAEKSNKMQDTQQALVSEQVSVIQDLPQPDNEMNLVLQDTVKKQAKPVATKPVVIKQVEQMPEQKHMIFSHVEQMPQYPGGEAALMKWLSDNIIYPPVAFEKGIQGRVSLRFVVTPDGSIEDVMVVKGLDPACDKEAITAVIKMPKWIPGKQNGNPVYVYYNLPVVFKLKTDDSETPASGTKNDKSPIWVSGKQNNQDVIIEIDGKVVSDEELEKLDPKDIESFSLKKDEKPNRLLIKTKK